MPIARDILLSIIGLDSYNRGYGAGVYISGGDTPGTFIGKAEVRKSQGTELPRDKGFYAIAYEWQGEKVISYRGTDNFDSLNDAVSGANDGRYGGVVTLPPPFIQP